MRQKVVCNHAEGYPPFATIALHAIQQNIKSSLLDDHDNNRFRKLDVLPKYHSRDLSPTPYQRIILSVLDSEHSLLFRGESYSGKSLSIAIHALNFTLSRVPKFGQISSGYSVDSVILVPTDDLVKKYLKYFRFLTKGLPTDCCPDQLVPEKEEYKASRRPLEIQFVYTDMHSDTLTTVFSTKNPNSVLDRNAITQSSS